MYKVNKIQKKNIYKKVSVVQYKSQIGMVGMSLRAKKSRTRQVNCDSWIASSSPLAYSI